MTALLLASDDDSVMVTGTNFDADAFPSPSFTLGRFIAVEGGEYIILVLQTT